MKPIASILFLLCFSLISNSQNTEQLSILKNFVQAHNNGTDEAISTFIKDTYHPKLLAKIDLNKHIAFYQHIVNEFGPLNDKIYEINESKSHKLVVHLIKQNEFIGNKSIDPAEILVVEIDLSEDNKRYMPHGLGLGALVCQRDKE